MGKHFSGTYIVLCKTPLTMAKPPTTFHKTLYCHRLVFQVCERWDLKTKEKQIVRHQTKQLSDSWIAYICINMYTLKDKQ